MAAEFPVAIIPYWHRINHNIFPSAVIWTIYLWGVNAFINEIQWLHWTKTGGRSTSYKNSVLSVKGTNWTDLGFKENVHKIIVSNFGVNCLEQACSVGHTVFLKMYTFFYQLNISAKCHHSGRWSSLKNKLRLLFLTSELSAPVRQAHNYYQTTWREKNKTVNRFIKPNCKYFTSCIIISCPESNRWSLNI